MGRRQGDAAANRTRDGAAARRGRRSARAHEDFASRAKRGQTLRRHGSRRAFRPRLDRLRGRVRPRRGDRRAARAGREKRGRDIIETRRESE